MPAEGRRPALACIGGNGVPAEGRHWGTECPAEGRHAGARSALSASWTTYVSTAVILTPTRIETIGTLDSSQEALLQVMSVKKINTVKSAQ